jgi:hypothetical protein
MRNAALGAGLPTPPNAQVRMALTFFRSQKSQKSQKSHESHNNRAAFQLPRYRLTSSRLSIL